MASRVYQEELAGLNCEVDPRSRTMGPVLIPATETLSHVGWLRINARTVRSAPTFYKRGRMWVLFLTDSALYVAYNQPELKRLVSAFREGLEGQWYEANIIDIEDAIGMELEAEE